MSRKLSFFILVFLLFCGAQAQAGCSNADITNRFDFYLFGGSGILSCYIHNGLCTNLSTGKNSPYQFVRGGFNKDCTFTMQLSLESGTYGNDLLILNGTLSKDKLSGAGYFTAGKTTGLFNMVRH